jgi:oligogalacturonide lyase
MVGNGIPLIGRMTVAMAFLCATSFAPAGAADLPRDWVDPATGHRIVRLSDEPGSLSLYFNFNAYTPQGDMMAISTPSGIAAVDLKTHKLTTIVEGKVRLLFTGHKTRQVYYEAGSEKSSDPKTIYAANIDTKKTHVVARIAHGTIQSINADETLLAGVEEIDQNVAIGADGMMKLGPVVQPDNPVIGPDGKPLTFALSKEARMNQRLDAKIPMEIFTIDLRTGVRKTVTGSTDWLNHLQFSPTDPNLLMYCHEGPWHKVDRLWMIRTDRADAKPVKLHNRTMNMEIAGHEWFSDNGKIIWYDLQTPRGEDFWVASYEIATGKRTWYHLQRNEWSVHFNTSPDGSVFSGDGGDSEMVAHAPDGKWMYLFRPHIIPDDIAGAKAPNADDLVHPGYFESEKLVNMKNHNYQLEPNARFSPDGKWLIFRSDMLGGASQVYAVELGKVAK